MNLRVLLLAASACVNAGLIAAFVARPALAPPAVREIFGAQPPAAAEAKPPPAPVKKASAPDRSRLWATLQAGDLPTLVARLRAAGFPASTIRGIVEAELDRQFRPRIEALAQAMAQTPYWKTDASYYFGNSKIGEELNQLYRDRSRALRELLGLDALAYGTADPAQARQHQFGNLSAGKIELVQRISEDYAEMTNQIRTAMQGVTLPEDREKFALLEREKRADLAAVLTAEELAEYEMRTSPVTARLRTMLTVLDASEAEFRAIYGAAIAQRDILYPENQNFYTSEMMEARRTAQKQMDEQIKATLGDARYADYQRASDSDFQQLYRLGQRDSVPYDTLVRAYDTRTSTLTAAMQIADDRQMSVEDKHAAVKNLVTDARTKVLSTLGPTTGPAYLESARWLTYLEQGRIMMPSSNSSLGTSIRSLPRLPANPKR